AIIHGHNCDHDKQIDVMMDINPERLKVEISDIGAIDFSDEIEAPDIDTLVKERKKGGMGLHLISTIMDEVKFFTRGSKSYCSLVKQFKSFD
ncbi:MAG: ATP-binding protein, partial [Bacteroidetes bacterium]|nr:ATP-binding protein [Bacteroidota bacterium]